MFDLFALVASAATGAAQPNPQDWKTSFQAAIPAISNCYTKGDQSTCEPAILAVVNAQNQAQANGETKADGFLEIQIAGLARRWSSGELDRNNNKLALAIASRGFQSLQAAMQRQGSPALLAHTNDLVGQLALTLHNNEDPAQADEAMGFLRKFGEQFWAARASATTPQQKQQLCAGMERLQRTEAKIGEKLVDGPSAAEAFRQAALWAERSSISCPDKPELPPASLYQATYLFNYTQALPSPFEPETKKIYEKIRELTCDVKDNTYKTGWGDLCYKAKLGLVGTTPQTDDPKYQFILPYKPIANPPIDFDLWRAIDAAGL